MSAKPLQWCPILLWTIVYQAPLSMGFSRQKYWSRLPCPPPGDLPNPGIEPTSLTSAALASCFFTTSATWEAQSLYTLLIKIDYNPEILNAKKTENERYYEV